jgi:hypothetical protein
MNRPKITRAMFIISIIFVILFAFAILELSPATPVVAQSAPCTDPLTGAACTPTPVVRRASPTPVGRPTSTNAPRPTVPPRPTQVPATPTEIYVRPTLSPTFTPTATEIPSATSVPTIAPTVTLIPSPTPFPTPTQVPVNPFVKPFVNLISLLQPPPNVVIQLPSWMQPDNIKVTDLEITQAIQCLHNPDCADNSVALYTGKPLVVRAYVKLIAGPDNLVYPIGGALCYGNTGAGGCSNPILSENKIGVTNPADAVSYGRGSAFTTLNFILPLSYSEGFSTHTLTVYANYKRQDLPSEVYYADNYKTLQYQMTDSQPIYVKYYPVQDKGFFPPAGQFATYQTYLAKTYPTGDVYPLLGVPLYGKNYDWSTPDSWGCPVGWHKLINDLWYMGGGTGPIAYGEVPYQSLSGGVIGCGVLGGPEAAGIAGASTDGRVAAQEIGHTMNLPHVPGCGAGGPDLNYPIANGLLDEFGFDTVNLGVYPPSSSYDFMGYCGGGSNTWTSIYTYNEIAGLLPRGVFNPSNIHLAELISKAAQPAKVLVGTGDLSPVSANLTEGFYLLDQGTFKTLTPDAGLYTVELQDAAGKVLYSQHFDLAQMSNDNPQTSGGFRLVLPWTEGTKKAVFLYNDKIIGKAIASAHAPTLELTSPMGGESWAPTGKQTITWTASDADRNPLSYMLQYSADEGKTWVMLAANLQDTSFTFDGDYLPGSDHGVIRVLATDGFNTTQVDSNQVKVAAKAPLISISSPAEGASFNAGTSVVLQGVGTDLLDGAILSGNFNWNSDRDGNLGNGSPLILTNLSTGAHTITLQVTNSSGLSASATVHIIVQAATPPSVTKTSMIVGALWLPILVVLLLVGLIVGLVLIIRGMKSKA